MRERAESDTGQGTILYRDGSAECLPVENASARAVVAATAARWFDRPAFYREAARVLIAGGMLGIAEYVRVEAPSAAARAVVHFLGQFGEERAYVRPDYVADGRAGRLRPGPSIPAPGHLLAKPGAIRWSCAFIVACPPSGREAWPRWSRRQAQGYRGRIVRQQWQGPIWLPVSKFHRDSSVKHFAGRRRCLTTLLNSQGRRTASDSAIWPSTDETSSTAATVNTDPGRQTSTIAVHSAP
jgi:Methyltransferase domain